MINWVNLGPKKKSPDIQPLSIDVVLRKSMITVHLFFSLTEMSSKMRSLDRELRGVRMEKEDIERVRLLL